MELITVLYLTLIYDLSLFQSELIWLVLVPLGYRVYCNSRDLICWLTIDIISNSYWSSSFKASFSLPQQPYQIHQSFYLIPWTKSNNELIYNLNGMHSIMQALLMQYQDNWVLKRRQNIKRNDMEIAHNMYSFSLKIIYICTKTQYDL